MKWFGRSRTNTKKQPLIQMVSSVGKDDEAAEGNPPPADAPAGDNAAPKKVVYDVDDRIPTQRVTSGERNMILPKHLKMNLGSNKSDDKDSDEPNGENPGYLPFVEVHTQSHEEDNSHDTNLISAISLSTIGASIEREVEVARNLKSQPPLEIKANTAQKARKKEPVSIFKRAGTAVKTAVTATLPQKVIDGLAAAYDKIHAPREIPEKNLDEVPVTARRYRRDHPDLLMPGNVPRVGITGMIAAIPLWVKYLAVGAVAAAAVATLALKLEDTVLGEEFFDWQEENFADWSEEKSLAFIGNSYFFVNDIPRMMQKISQGRIHSNSCINPSASLGKLLRAGNGMYEYWDTEQAITYKYNTEWNEEAEDGGVYDFGSCSVFQLLEGYDNDLSYMNYNGAYYYEEGMNPCFEDKNYLIYLQDYNLKHPQIYDYVILNDQTGRMADADAREDTVEALKFAYAPMILDSRAKPLIVDTHAYPIESGSNETAWGDDIPYMQAMIYKGVDEYLMALKYNLPSYQEPKVVPIGLAYNVVWEEDFTMWTKLFLNETMPYASPYGSYLFANVLYASVYGHLPRKPTSQEDIKKYFASARYLPDLPEDWTGIFPTIEEADYLRLVARRVSLNGYIPVTFKKAQEEIEAKRTATEEEVEECVCEEKEECEEGDEDCEAAEAEEECEEGDEDCEQQEAGAEECECQNAAEGEEDADMDEQENRRRLL